MKYSQQTIKFAQHLVYHYANFDKLSNNFVININDLPDTDLHEMVTLLMLDNKDMATEATGPDNPSYDKTMLPALLDFMRDTSDKDNEIEFTKVWRDGIANYFMTTIVELLDEQCIYRLHDEQNYAGHFAKRRSDNDEIYWSTC